MILYSTYRPAAGEIKPTPVHDSERDPGYLCVTSSTAGNKKASLQNIPSGNMTVPGYLRGYSTFIPSGAAGSGSVSYRCFLLPRYSQMCLLFMD